LPGIDEISAGSAIFYNSSIHGLAAEPGSKSAEHDIGVHIPEPGMPEGRRQAADDLKAAPHARWRRTKLNCMAVTARSRARAKE
jgi:hypothetical protein